MKILLRVINRCCNWKENLPSPIGLLTIAQFMGLFVYFFIQNNLTPYLPKISSSFSEGKSISVKTTEELDKVFLKYNYHLKDIRNGTTRVPFLLLEKLPDNFHKTKEIEKRKKLFIKIVLPMALAVNRKINSYREALLTLSKNHNKLNKREQRWIHSLSKQHNKNSIEIKSLLDQLAPIPVSLFLAQSAIESGWGTSRFAREGNALFGQWTWSGEGIKPAGADTNATYKVMKFNVLKASVRAYQRNLNTHSSYKKFRFIRAQLRDDNKKLDSLKLAEYLDNYAQTGTEYTKVLKQIIQQNQLKDFDEVKLLPLSVKYKNII